MVPPSLLYNALFVCFHANPIGGHLNAFCTHSRLRLRYYWSGMYSYCVHKCRQCPGYALSNPTMKITELVYKFPIEAPFNVLHADGYKTGKHFNFEGTGTYIITAYGMTGFAACKPGANKSATTYASAVMKIVL